MREDTRIRRFLKSDAIVSLIWQGEDFLQVTLKNGEKKNIRAFDVPRFWPIISRSIRPKKRA